MSRVFIDGVPTERMVAELRTRLDQLDVQAREAFLGPWVPTDPSPSLWMGLSAALRTVVERMASYIEAPADTLTAADVELRYEARRILAALYEGLEA